jgi:hypothetical protein
MVLGKDEEYHVKEHVVGMVHRAEGSHSKSKNPDYILNYVRQYRFGAAGSLSLQNASP